MTEFTASERDYVYKIKFYLNTEKHTLSGWIRRLSNPKLKTTAYRTIKKMIETGMLRKIRRTTIDGYDIYAVDDKGIVEFFETSEKHKRERIINNELIERRWSSKPSIIID